MLERIMMAGSGGQGVMSLGKLFARVAVDTVPYVTFFPAYGTEVRGGTSHCQVILSSSEIASPLAEQFDSLLVMNKQSAGRFLAQLDPRGLAIVNRSLCEVDEEPRLVPVHATEIADRLGNPRATNLVMLGALLARKPLVSPEAVRDAIAAGFAGAKGALADSNLRAFQAGLQI